MKRTERKISNQRQMESRDCNIPCQWSTLIAYCDTILTINFKNESETNKFTYQILICLPSPSPLPVSLLQLSRWLLPSCLLSTNRPIWLQIQIFNVKKRVTIQVVSFFQFFFGKHNKRLENNITSKVGGKQKLSVIRTWIHPQPCPLPQKQLVDHLHHAFLQSLPHHDHSLIDFRRFHLVMKESRHMAA